MSLITHARRELTAAGLFDADSDYSGKLGESVMDLVTAFANQGHSGYSAELVLDLFHKVAGYQILTPLEDKEDEWVDVSEHSGYPHFQNRRLSSVFKDGNGVVTSVDATVYVNPDGSTFTQGSTVIQLPWVPSQTRIYLDWEGNQISHRDWKLLSHEHEELAEVGVENIEDLNIKNVPTDSLEPIPVSASLTGKIDNDVLMAEYFVDYAKTHEKILYVTNWGYQRILMLQDFQPVKLHSLLTKFGFVGTCRGVAVVTNAFHHPTGDTDVIVLPGEFCTAQVDAPDTTATTESEEAKED